MNITPSPAPLDINVHRQSAAVVRVTVAGEVDMSTTGSLLDVLIRTQPMARPGHIAVDLGGVTFLDCGGLTALLVAREAAARADCSLLIVDPRPAVRRVLILTGLLDVLTAGPAANR